jgi:hypothetical protein
MLLIGAAGCGYEVPNPTIDRPLNDRAQQAPLEAVERAAWADVDREPLAKGAKHLFLGVCRPYKHRPSRVECTVSFEDYPPADGNESQEKFCIAAYAVNRDGTNVERLLDIGEQGFQCDSASDGGWPTLGREGGR